jgi:mannitol/fructose-specific phosphotransferase system IIA component (Ntr-type)
MEVVWGNKTKKQGEQMEIRDIVDCFNESLFIPKLKAKTKKDSLLELAELFVHAKIIRKADIVLEMLRKRETLGSTGIGKGVAIPHGRTTAAIDVKIAFGKSEAGLDYDAIDKKPVHLIFVVLAPPQEENSRYLPILGKLVEVVSDRKNRDKLLKAANYEEFKNVFLGI